VDEYPLSWVFDSKESQESSQRMAPSLPSSHASDGMATQEHKGTEALCSEILDATLTGMEMSAGGCKGTLGFFIYRGTFDGSREIG